MDKIIEDDELGRLIVRVNSRARRLVFRTKSDAVYVSVPPGTTLKEVKQAVENLRGKLLASRQKLARPLIDLNYKIDAEHFKLSLVSGEKDQFLANSRLGVMEIVCPPHADFTDEKLQSLSLIHIYQPWKEVQSRTGSRFQTGTPCGDCCQYGF